MIETSDLKAKACEKAEDPKYIEEKQLKVDRLYYTEHQIVNPICSLLDLVIDDPKKLFVDHIRTLTNQRKSQNTIFSFLKRKPEEIMSVNNVAQSEQSLDQYDKSKDENAAADVVESVSSCTNERDVLIIEKEAASAFEDAMMNMGSTTRIVKNPPKKKKKVAAK